MQDILTYAYILLAIAAFWYWISSILGFARMVKFRKPGQSLLKVASFGAFNIDNFTEQGNMERHNTLVSIGKFTGCVLGLVIVVIVGIQTQA